MAGSVYSNPIGAAIDSYATLSGTLDNQENSAIRRKLMEKEIENKGLNNQRTKQLMRAGDLDIEHKKQMMRAGDLDIEHKKQTMAEEKRKADIQKNVIETEQRQAAASGLPAEVIKNYVEIGKAKQEDHSNDPSWKRPDGTMKGNGFLGVLKMTDGSGKDMSEFSVGVPINGKEMDIPTLVPTLTKKEIDHLLSGGKPTDEIVKKAAEHAEKRIKEGKSVFADNSESPSTGKASSQTTPEQHMSVDYVGNKSSMFSGKSPEEVKGITNAIAIMGEEFGKYKDQIMKGGILREQQAPRLFEAWNTALYGQINKGAGGRKRVTGVIFDPKTQTFTALVTMTGPDGQTKEEPMTVGRNPMEDKSQVLQIPAAHFEAYLTAQYQLGMKLQATQAWIAANPGKYTELQMEQRKNIEIGQMRQQGAADLRQYREQHPGATTNDQRTFLMEHLSASMDPKVFESIVKDIIQEKTDNLPPDIKRSKYLADHPEERKQIIKDAKDFTTATTHVHVHTGKGGEAKLTREQKRLTEEIRDKAKKEIKRLTEADPTANQDEIEDAVNKKKNDAIEAVEEGRAKSSGEAWGEAAKDNPVKEDALENRFQDWIKRDGKDQKKFGNKDTPDSRAAFEKKMNVKFPGGAKKTVNSGGDLKGNKITVNGKQYDVVDGTFTMDGKKYKVTK